MKSVNAITCRRYNPSVFSACKQAENPAPLTQGSRETHRKPSAGTPYRGSKKCSVNAFPGRGYNPSVTAFQSLNRRASSPCTVGFRVPPVADTTRKASCCRPQVRERTAEARAANGEGAEIPPPPPGRHLP